MLPCKRSWETRQGSMYLKPTERCNLQCRHCYVSGMPETDMTLVQLELIFKKVARYMANGNNSRVRFIWHGGEPMLMGPGFYEKANKLKDNIFGRTKAVFSLQTNMLLLDKSWVSAIKTVFNNTLGTSFDWGLRDIDGSWERFRDRWLERYEFARRSKIRVAGVIMVVNRKVVGREEEIYRFFAQLPGTALDTYPYVPLGYGKTNQDEFALRPYEYARFLMKLSDLYLAGLAGSRNGKGRITISVLLRLYKALLTDKPAGTIWTGNCSYNNLVVNPDGSVYGCPHLAGIRNGSYGSIYKDSLEQILKSPNRQKAIRRQVFIPEDCGSCQFMTTCGCGCLAHSLALGGVISEPDSLCGDYKMLFQHLKDSLSRYRIENIRDLNKEIGNIMPHT